MPSMINELALAEIRDFVGRNASLMFVDPARLKAKESLALRRQLYDIGAHMKVAKARLVRQALDEPTAGVLAGKGALGLIGGEDIAAAAKIIRDLAEAERVVVRGGVSEGTPLDAASALKLADLPSKHEARAMVARAVRGPVVKLAKLLKAPYRRLGRAVMARKEKLEE